MNAPINPEQSKTKSAFQNISQWIKDLEMKTVNGMIKVKSEISKVWAMPRPVRMLGGGVALVALSALLVATAIGVSGSQTNADALEMNTSNQRIEAFPANESVPGFLNQGQAGYSLEEQVEIASISNALDTPKVERVPGFLGQGQAGYSLEEQEEIWEESGYFFSRLEEGSSEVVTPSYEQQEILEED